MREMEMRDSVRSLGVSHVSALTLLGVLMVLVAGAVPAGAKPPEELIAFKDDRAGQSDIWTMRPDGSNHVRLTDDKTDDQIPAWSPNGKKIAWTRVGDGIWVMNADGSGKRQITFNASDTGATWSPDGSRIAFRSIRGGNRDIYVINVDGTNEQRLTDDPSLDVSPDWSPDGTKIGFTSERSGTCAVYTMNPDGSNVQKLTPDSMHAARPGWSPDGSHLIFSDNFCVNVESDLFVMDPDGGEITQVTDSPENELSKSWSPDGTRVVADFAKVTPNGLSKGEIAVIDVSSGATVNLTNSPNNSEGDPDWSPR
jgi:Tol biopolymer transport system component